jgi:hypothetical protein
MWKEAVEGSDYCLFERNWTILNKNMSLLTQVGNFTKVMQRWGWRHTNKIRDIEF